MNVRLLQDCCEGRVVDIDVLEYVKRQMLDRAAATPYAYQRNEIGKAVKEIRDRIDALSHR